MRFSDEKYEELKALIRRMRQLKPKLSASEIARNLNIDWALARRLLKKVEGERLALIKQAMVDNDLSDVMEFIKEASPEIKRIIFDKSASDKDKIAAFKAVVEGKDKEMNMKMDAGIYQRNLGKLDIERKLSDEDEALLKRALQHATDRSRLGEGEQEPTSTESDGKK